MKRHRRFALVGAVLGILGVIVGCGTTNVSTQTANTSNMTQEKTYPNFAGKISRCLSCIKQQKVQTIVPPPYNHLSSIKIDDMWEGKLSGGQHFTLFSWVKYGKQGYTAIINGKKYVGTPGNVTFFRFTGDYACYFTQAGNYVGCINLKNGYQTWAYDESLALKIGGHPFNFLSSNATVAGIPNSQYSVWIKK